MERPADDLVHDLPPAPAPADAEPLLRARDLRVQFDDFLAVGGVSLSLNPGDLLGLVGPNGAGKTTLLRTLAGLQPASSGGIWILGRRMEPGDADAMRHIGFTADEPPVYEQMKVRQFLRFIAAGYGSTGTEVDERIDFWLEKVWLTDKADQPIKNLSRGMRQRIGIARTLLPNPAVILLDEPAAGLDPAGRAQFRELLMTLRQQGKALIVSSHILSDLAEYCSHIGIMGKGRMIRYGTVAQIADEETEHATYAARFTSEDEAMILARLAKLPGVLRVVRRGDKYDIDAAPGKPAAAALLEEIVKAGLPLYAFGLESGGLEQAYLRSGIGQVD